MQEKMYCCIIFLVFFCLVVECDSYRAGVVQSASIVDVTTFIPFISQAKNEKVDILVFPELSLKQAQYGPSAFEIIDVGINPCEKFSTDRPIQTNMSCSTKENEIYVVFDMVERGEKCERGTQYCDYGFFIYNTAVILDRAGTIIGKYRKHNPVVPQIKPGDPVLYHFETDFGVEFGVFICYDVLQKMPGEDIVRYKKINNIIFPTFWMDLSFIMGSPIQQGYSEYFQTNFIAANTVLSSNGSGIYSKGKPLSFDDSFSTKLIVSDVPLFDYIEPPPIFKGRPMPWQVGKDIKFIQPGLPPPSSRTQKITSSKGGRREIEHHHFELDSHSCDISYRVKSSGGVNMSKEYFIVGAIRSQFGSVQTDSCVLLNCGDVDEKPKDLEHCINLEPQTVFDFVQVNITLVDNIRIVLPMITTRDKRPISQQFFDGMVFDHNIPGRHSVTLNEVDEPPSFVVQFGIY